jgi:UDP-N-acetylmuramate: L-alanyl-gamma-D-glutamyl-meso-diaminopimelate ligase
MKIHLIAIGGALMHNLAMALKNAGHEVGGSDDEIYEPARGRLSAAGLLPISEGWHEARITTDIELVILGMHARKNNPELLKAQDLGLKIVSYPEFLRQHSEAKTRVAVAGSHGKTTTTALIMHILRHNNINFDYAVGAMLEGFDTMVRLSDAPIIVIEADEYLSSPIDLRPKFLHYAPQIAIITGIEHDHFNVFPTLDDYLRAFSDFMLSLPPNAQLIYYRHSPHLAELLPHCSPTVLTTGYDTPAHQIVAQKTQLLPQHLPPVHLAIFGAHNLQNIAAARLACLSLGLNDSQIYAALPSFGGAARRLQCLKSTPQCTIFSDFAHAPSKVRATVQAIRAQYIDYQLIAAVELHTFSSLNADFLPNYAHTLDAADVAFLHFSPHTLAQKRLPPLQAQQICQAFARADIGVFEQAEPLRAAIKSQIDASTRPTVVLLMSSGTWSGMNLLF